MHFPRSSFIGRCTVGLGTLRLGTLGLGTLGLATLATVAVVATGTAATGSTASAAPQKRVPISRPGGLTPHAVPLTAGDCQLTGVSCKPYSSTSCTGYSSQTTPPTTIRVLVRTSSTAATIQTVDFQTYVNNVLPNEWLPSWDEEALKAGAVAVKSYAWYWVTHFGGYVGSETDCFDVTDDTSFQVYRADSASTRTSTAVAASWPVALRRDGKIVQASYLAYLDSSSETCGASTNGNQLSQYGTQACAEASTGNKYNVILGKYYSAASLASARQLRTQHDFEFAQHSTRATFNAGRWSIDDGYATTFSFGVAGDRPVITTDGDGFARIGVFRPSTATWYVGSPTGTVKTKVQFGAPGDVAVPAQYAGVHKPTVLAVFRPTTGRWYQANPTGSTASLVHFGVAGDIPVPGHYTGSSATDYADGIAVFRPSDGRWYVPGRPRVRYGLRGDIPMPADYDGNGTTDLAVYRPSNHRFYLIGHASVPFGVAGDIPVTGDFTGDGRADLAVYRPSTRTWFVRAGSTAVFGSSGDVPIGAAPYSD